MNTSMLTLTEWQTAHPDRWAKIEGSITRNELRTLKFLDAQVHLTREAQDGLAPPETPEVRWLRSCIAIYLYVCAHGIFPKDEHSVSWVKNQRRGALCDYQVAALQQIPGWQWRPRRTSWDERMESLGRFRNEYGREPRVRSTWEYERALAHWATRQRKAASEGKLSPRQESLLDGDGGLPTGEITWAMPTFAGSYEVWFRDFWGGLLREPGVQSSVANTKTTEGVAP